MQDTNEIWKDVPGYPTFQVSNTNKIRHLSYSYTNAKGHVVTIPEREITTFVNPKGYQRCDLCVQGEKKKPTTVHRIVMYAFKGMPPAGFDQINHIDGNKLNNHPDNLECSNNSHNIKHAWANGLHNPNLPKSLDSPHAIIVVHKECGYFCTVIEAAAESGINRSTLSKMVKGVKENNSKYILA